MSRSTPEWVGKSDDTAIPTRVKIRVFDACAGKCAECKRKLGVAGESVEYDHRIALVNGGENRELNLQALCRNCHKGKTRQDVATKSTDRRVKSKRLGISKPKSTMACGVFAILSRPVSCSVR